MNDPVTILFVGGGIFWMLAGLSLLLPRKLKLDHVMCFMLLGTLVTSFAGGMLAERHKSALPSVANPRTEATK